MGKDLPTQPRDIECWELLLISVIERWQTGPAFVRMTNCLIFFNEKIILHLSNDRELGSDLQ
jgi:hypothetical protein